MIYHFHVRILADSFYLLGVNKFFIIGPRIDNENLEKIMKESLQDEGEESQLWYDQRDDFVSEDLEDLAKIFLNGKYKVIDTFDGSMKPVEEDFFY